MSKSKPKLYEAEVLEGLEQLAKNELDQLNGVVINKVENGSLNFSFKGTTEKLKGLGLIIAVYATLHFDIPRPRALLGDQNQKRLLGFLKSIIKQDDFTSFRLSAAGHDSAIFKRLCKVIASHTMLPFVEKDGDLLLRIRPHKTRGWEVLARLTPRPLSTRPWRVCNMAGGLNATLAVAMLKLVKPKSSDHLFNPMCGSGTLLIEAYQNFNFSNISGCDSSGSALSCAQQNIVASGFQNSIGLFLSDATELSMSSECIDVVVCDLPWGDAVGTNRANATLYPAFIKEMTRVTKKNARMILLSHNIKLVERLVPSFPVWELKSKQRVFHSGHYPRMYLLFRNSRV